MKESFNYQDFLDSLKNEYPSESLPESLQALWYDAKGNWNASHDIAQDIPSKLGCWIHAYLHRKEGDKFNAQYWYRRANKPYPTFTLEEEFRILVDYILNTKELN
ncbi:hypothetical protein [uncultured Eudoraea sp.]|uniref:hypothetical protein n=1 Tax=uncultured Eudoraea sp. TaxID=1035614 RepID=UPI0026247CFD|nr:hypothetical protein [uncultured Eudoraea sp.]